jgi:hypothetical protein
VHAEQAGDTRALVDHAPVAAEEAIRLGSYSQAIDDLELLLAQAATLPDRTVALACSQLSYALYTVNRFADSAAHGWRGVAAAEAAGDATVVADALLRLTRTLYWSDGPRAAAQAIERALPQLEALGDDARLATAHAEVARVHSDLVAVGPVAEPDPEGDPHGDRRAGLEGHRAAEVGGEHGRVGAGDTDRADLERVGRGPVLQGHVERGRLADGRGWEAQRGRRGRRGRRGDEGPGTGVRGHRRARQRDAQVAAPRVVHAQGGRPRPGRRGREHDGDGGRLAGGERHGGCVVEAVGEHAGVGPGDARRLDRQGPRLGGILDRHVLRRLLADHGLGGTPTTTVWPAGTRWPRSSTPRARTRPRPARAPPPVPSSP